MAVLAGVFCIPASAMDFHVDGTQFVVTQDVAVRRSADLIGVQLDLGNGATLRVDAVRTDPVDPELMWHTFAILGADGEWRNPCKPDAEGRGEGLPLPGRWQADGRFVMDGGHFALTCAGGAQAKCLQFGYKPWGKTASGVSLHPHYEACVRMVRADYCGDGRPATASGTRIDVYDDVGIMRPQSDATYAFEAGWSPTGAVCVEHTRVPENLTLEALGEICPRLADKLGPTCTEQAARRNSAILFNRSR